MQLFLFLAYPFIDSEDKIEKQIYHELVFKTKSLIESLDDLKRMSKKAIGKCQKFSKDNFEKDLLNLIKK